MGMSNAGLAKRKRTRGESGEPLPKPVPREARTRGRPELYEQAWVARACELARNGATDIEIAQDLGCSVKVFYETCGRHPEFREAVNASKEIFDERVERSYGQRAVGYNIETEKVFANGTRLTVIEHIPADTGAGANWLANRRRDKGWNKAHEVSIVVPVADDSPETLDQRQLALAALALISEAAYNPATPAPITIEASPNPEEGTDDEEADTEATQVARRPRRGQRAPAPEQPDPDFDFQ